MSELSDSNENAGNPAGPSATWIATVTAAAGIMAALIIAILRRGKPRRSPVQFSGSRPPALAEETWLKTQAQTNMQATLRNTEPPPTQSTRSASPTPSSVLPAPAPSTRWSPTTKYIVAVGLFLSIIFLIFISRGSLSMIIFAGLIAFVVRPLIGWFQRRLKIKRGAATGITYLLVIILLITLPLILIPPIIDGINYLLDINYQAVAQNLSSWLQTAAVQVQNVPVIGAIIGPLLASLNLALQDLSTAATPTPVEPVTYTSLTSQLARLMGILVNVLGPLVSAAISFVFMLLISLHMSLSAETLQKSYPQLIPESYRPEISDLIERIVNVWSSFLRGQLSLMVVMGVLTFLLNWLLGTPYPLFLGFLAGALEIIPSLGPFLATIPAVLLALFVGSTRFAIDPVIFALIVIAGYILLSAMENQILVPKILGGAVSLPPLVVILGVVIFGALFGILGIFLATPIISTGKEVYSYLYDKILEPPPVEEPPEVKQVGS